MVEPCTLVMMGLVVSWRTGKKWGSAFGKWFDPLQNCQLNVLKEDMDKLIIILFTFKMKFCPHISLQPAPGFYSVYPHWCHPRKFPSLWTLLKNSKGYQDLWNGKKIKNCLLSKTNLAKYLVPKLQTDCLQWRATHVFLFQWWRWKLYP